MVIFTSNIELGVNCGNVCPTDLAWKWVALDDFRTVSSPTGHLQCAKSSCLSCSRFDRAGNWAVIVIPIPPPETNIQTSCCTYLLYNIVLQTILGMGMGMNITASRQEFQIAGPYRGWQTQNADWWCKVACHAKGILQPHVYISISLSLSIYIYIYITIVCRTPIDKKHMRHNCGDQYVHVPTIHRTYAKTWTKADRISFNMTHTQTKHIIILLFEHDLTQLRIISYELASLMHNCKHKYHYIAVQGREVRDDGI